MIDAIAEALAGVRWPGFPDEYLLQLTADQVLTGAGYVVDTEVRLDPAGRDRIDLLVNGSVGVECKVAGTADAARRQVSRYLKHETVTGVVILTSRACHLELRTSDLPIRVVFTGAVL